MFLKNIFICFIIIKLSYCYKSFTLVIDTTNSMGEELDILKYKLSAAINLNWNKSIIDEYMLVTFKDPDVSEPLIFKTPDELVTAVNRLTASGGNECPENTLAAIELALRRSKPTSNIFVITDAYAKDYDKLSAIDHLCKSTRSQVVIFLTNFCNPTPYINVQTYHNVAKACQGAIFNLDDAIELRKVFNYVKEVISEDWSDIIAYEPFTDSKTIRFSVNSFTKRILLAVSGKYPSILISPVDNSTSTYENVLEAKHAQVFSLVDPTPGEYSVAIRCQGTTAVILYKKVELNFQIGFSIEKPRSLLETSYRPIAGRKNYILLRVLNAFKVEKISMEVFNEQKNVTLDIKEIQKDNIYVVNTFIEPDKSFCIWIQGYDTLTSEIILASTMTVIPQQTVIDPEWRSPTAEIIDKMPVIMNYTKNGTVACKVIGYPTPNVWWEDDEGVTLNTSTGAVLLELPLMYISYLQLVNVTMNQTVHCKCKNSEGEYTTSLDIYMYRPYTFEVLQTPENQTTEYGSDGKLLCQVSAYPKAETKWYHNGTLVTDMDDYKILPDEYALAIYNMNLDKAGEYECKISNEVNERTYTAYIDISGMEAPQVDVEESNIYLKVGDRTEVMCSITKGTPAPELSWEFKPEDAYNFGKLLKTVEVHGQSLKITAAQKDHSGIYRCNANNIIGQHYADITLVVQSSPKIINNESETIVVKEDEDVELFCEVTASPAASVKWEMTQDDVIITLDDRHHTDEQNTHRFRALSKDSGNYHCVAENNIGTAKKTVTVNVLVKPYIEPPTSNALTVRAGNTVVLLCNVTYGNPVPTTKWEFTGTNSATKVVKRSNSSNLLYIARVRYSDAGLYACFADNEVGTDNIKIYVNVQ